MCYNLVSQHNFFSNVTKKNDDSPREQKAAFSLTPTEIWSVCTKNNTKTAAVTRQHSLF